MTQSLKFDIDAAGIATITIDTPNKSVNVLDQKTLGELAALIEKVATDDKIKGAVITSAKETFVAGVDLSLLAGLAALARAGKVKEAYAQAFQLNQMLRRLETSGKPFVAAVTGLALGGGFELMLACHYRIVADDPKVKLGLPEVRVGLLPGGGGTQRLPRLIGIQPSAPILMQGKQVSPQEALEMGIVQKLAPRENLVAEAKAWIAGGGSPVQPWDRKEFKIPGGGGQFNPTIVQTFMVGSALMQQETWHNYPAPPAILSAVYEGHQLPMDRAIAVESRYFTTLLEDPTAGNMIRTLFLNKQEADKLKRRPKDLPPTPTKKLGVLGAGLMGAGIANVSAQAGMEVVLLDRDQPSADRGRGHIEADLEKSVKRGRMTKDMAAAILERVKATADYGDLKGCDLIIEAVFEDQKVKAEATKKAEAVIGADAVFATNTSTIPITLLAEPSGRPKNFIGIHFFSPVERMPLIEIIKGKETGDPALAKALDYVRQVRKTPIVVNDSRGFYTSRTFGTYISEGTELLKEGVSPALIENAGRLTGMPMGPLEVADQVGIDLMVHVYDSMKGHLGHSYASDTGDHAARILADDLIRPGQKAGKGFYYYAEKHEKRLWPGLKDHFPVSDEQPPVDDVKKRLFYIQVLETARCFEEDVVTTPEEADLGAILGWGFSPFTGGPLSFIDTVGAKAFVAECDDLAARFGPRFTPPDLLRRMAKEGKTFYKQLLPA
jgi:3-hydroxyacyl-CoA dehydrogenase/enoyl-CoA hydratase/3-hydroxybutyryl-CoA epimerase